jgi:hypothetical protein
MGNVLPACSSLTRQHKPTKGTYPFIQGTNLVESEARGEKKKFPQSEDEFQTLTQYQVIREYIPYQV